VPLETAYREINQRIHQLMPVGRFLCLFLIRLDPRAGTLTVLNAGLPDAFLGFPEGRIRRFPSRNLPAGILPELQRPEMETVAVPPGSRLLACTDGVLEVCPQDIVEQRLMRDLLSCPLTVHRHAIQEILTVGVGNQEQHDDVTWALWEVPAAGVLPSPAPEAPAGTLEMDLDNHLSLDLAFAPHPHDVRDVVPDLVRLLTARGLSLSPGQVLALTLSEALSNALDHGLLHLDPVLKHTDVERYEALRKLHLASLQEGQLRLALRVRTLPSGPIQEIQVTVEDPGSGVDWRAGQRAETDPSAPSGRGLRVLQALTRDLSFNESGNRIQFTVPCA
jgi:anti-sigma regulatory factor (Ser/Thr protein kinase)